MSGLSMNFHHWKMPPLTQNARAEEVNQSVMESSCLDPGGVKDEKLYSQVEVDEIYVALK